MADRIFLYISNDNVAAGPFVASLFDGTAQTSDDFDSGYATLTCATATDTRIYAYDDVGEMIRVWDADTKVQITSEEGSPNSPGDTYRAMYHTDTHLVLINDDDDVAEHYNLSGLSYDSGENYSLPSGGYTAACRGGDYAWIGNNSGDVVERRDLDGSNPVTYDPGINIILHTIFATTDRVHFVNQSTGATTAIDFSGNTQTADNLALGAGRWRASFVTFEPAEDVDLAITPAGPFTITVGTRNYSQPITVVGSTAATDVTLEGDWEGFYMDWDRANDTLTVKSSEVTRVVGEYVWLVTAVDGGTTVTEEIVYSVVPAAPIITPITETVAIFRDVPANLDILIQNTPDTSSVEGLQVGMKYEAGELFEGLKVDGMLPMDAVLTETTFTAASIAENAAARVTSDIDCELMTGSPPQIVSPEFTPKGNYGELEFTDPTHALGYEWTLATGDVDDLLPEAWTFFNSTRNVIDPGEVEITPGNLNVSLTFPNVTGALSYEYMLESETHNVDWRRLTTTLANSMITTIIPDLEDGETYTLRLRVASPWVGSPVSVPVYGGRIAYCIHKGNGTE